MAGRKAGTLKKDGTVAGKPGARAHEPTPELRARVEFLSGIGLKHEDITIAIGLSDDKTLRAHYEHELKAGKVKANAQIAQGLFKQANDGNLAARIFWLKTQAGWREVQHVEHTGPGGGPIAVAALMGSVESFLGALFGGGKRPVIDVTPAPALIEGGTGGEEGTP